MPGTPERWSSLSRGENSPFSTCFLFQFELGKLGWRPAVTGTIQTLRDRIHGTEAAQDVQAELDSCATELVVCSGAGAGIFSEFVSLSINGDHNTHLAGRCKDQVI